MTGRRSDDERSTADRVVWWLLGLFSAVILAAITAFSATVRSQGAQIESNQVNIAVIQNDLKYIRTSVDGLNVKIDGMRKK